MYGCQNGSLVINRRKGIHSVSYKCLNTGTYDVPKGKELGEPWPECTLKPVDPCEYLLSLVFQLFRHIPGGYQEANFAKALVEGHEHEGLS